MKFGETFGSLRNIRPSRSAAIPKLSDDPVVLAQILILFRVVLADGVIGDVELGCFQEICDREFGIVAEEWPVVHALLESPTGLVAESQMFLLLKRLDGLARSRLLGMMAELAGAGPNDSSRAARLVRLTARSLEDGHMDMRR